MMLGVVLRRELRSYFATPIAYVFIGIFLVLSGVFTFYLGNFFERQQADLIPFFSFHPWLYLFLIPAVSMRLWSEEQKSGTLELLMTLPLSRLDIVLGKFLAAWLFAGLALLLTFPLWLTVNYLGDPDNGVILASYIGSWLMAGAFLAIGSTMSALTRSQVIAFVLCGFVSLLFVMAGFPLVIDVFKGWVALPVLDMVASLSFLTHFNAISRGVLSLQDLLFFVSVIVAWLLATAIILESRNLLSLLLVAAGFLLFSLFNSLLLSGARIDLTENRLYTLSDGTLQVIEDVEEPINLYFFFSEGLSEDLTSLRAYARRVEDMLQEYALAGGDRIRLEVIDPEPFSESEDRAGAYGLQGVPVNQAGDELYFGLVGTNSLDGEEVIPFFQPDREAFLEYEISKLVSNLAVSDKPVIKVFSGLEVTGGFDQMSMQPREAWVFYSQLEELFTLELLETLEPGVLATDDLLLLIHPKALTETQLFTIDQHVVSGGRLIAFLDAMAEMDAPASPGMPRMPGQGASDLNQLTSNWGVTLRTGEVLGDAEVALMVGGPGGVPVRHLGILGFGSQNLSADNVATADLETVNMSTVGFFDLDTRDGIETEVLVQSGTRAAPLQTMQLQFMSNPEDLLKGFTPTGERYPVAVRVSGQAETAFPEGLPGGADEDQEGTPAELVTSGQLQVLLIADTDLLSDRLWVQVQNFFGQQIASAFADNGSFVINLVEQFSGRNALMEVRSRGQFTRPFSVVQSLRLDAEERYLQSAEDLQAQLQETERQLTELEATQQEDGLLILSPEQEAALERFQGEKLRIRKELRDVRHQLDKEIEDLGAMLKLLNILLMPLLLTGLLLVARFLGLFRRSSASTGGSATGSAKGVPS